MLSILRDHETYGPFCMDLIHAMLEEGRIVPSDLAREEGGKWKPLEVFLREPAILHSSPPVVMAPRLEGVQERERYLNSPKPGQRNITPYLAASFSSGYKPFKARLEDCFGCFIMGIILLIVPFIGWTIGPVVMMAGVFQLFDSRPDPKTFGEGCTRMIGDYYRNGYRAGYMLFLGVASTVIGIASIAALITLDLDDAAVPGLWMIGPAGLAGGGVWIYCYLVPKHLR